MTEIQTDPTVSTITAKIKKGEKPFPCDIRGVSELDMKRFVYTGWSASIRTPLVKNSNNAILAIRCDGYMPPYIMGNTTQWEALTNFAPIQPIFGGPNANIGINSEVCPLPQFAEILSNRFMAGSVGIGLRITSNTSQQGNLLITQATGVARKFYSSNLAFPDPYLGYAIVNGSNSPIDYSSSGFMVADLSLNRTVNIVATRRDNTKATDLVVRTAGMRDNSILAFSSAKMNVFLTQFVEDVLLIAPLSDLPGPDTIHIALFYDFSRVQFYEPMYPMLPIFWTTRTQTLLDYMASFYGKPYVARSLYVFLG